jgi:hypothetical protein
VVNEVPNLVSMRTVHLPRTIEYYVTRGELGVGRFSVVRVNRESVRALWAAQQHELLYLINGDAERGSIQQMRPCLRNVINQSCDAPVGYPIFVAPIASAFGGELMREVYASKPPAPAKNPRRFARDDIDVEMRQMRGPAAHASVDGGAATTHASAAASSRRLDFVKTTCDSLFILHSLRRHHHHRRRQSPACRCCRQRTRAPAQVDRRCSWR